MPDGKRRRRHSPNRSKRAWYAAHRARRFFRRFSLSEVEPLLLGAAPQMALAKVPVRTR